MEKPIIIPERYASKIRRPENVKPLNIYLLQGNILDMSIDAIIDPANEDLDPMGGLSAKIASAAGRGYVKEMRTLGKVATGKARIQNGGDLPARHVIHAVGPIYPYPPTDDWSRQYEDYMTADEEGKRRIMQEYDQICEQKKAQLAQTYRSVLLVARENNLRSIGFPAISTGVFNFPQEEAAKIVHDTLYEDLQKNGQGTLEEIRFVLFDSKSYQLYVQNFAENG